MSITKEPLGGRHEYWKVEALDKDGLFGGSLSIDVCPQGRPEFAEVIGVYVEDKDRRKGIARSLYLVAARELQKKGVRLLGGEVAAQATFDIRKQVFGRPEYAATSTEEVDPETARDRLQPVMHDETSANKVYVRSRISPRRKF